MLDCEQCLHKRLLKKCNIYGLNARVYLYMRKDIFHNRPISLSTDCYFLEVLGISETK